MAKSQMSLEEANAVIRKHRAAEQRKIAEQNRALVGKCYRYRNTFGDGKHWWLYGEVIGVDRWGSPQARLFQAKANGSFEVETRSHYSSGGWVEISRRQFERAKSEFTARVVRELKK